VSSVVGPSVSFRGGAPPPRAYRFMVGDNSDISIL
jgi:hypothetical protein